MKPNRNKNAILLAVACVALLGAGFSLYLQLAPAAPDQPVAAADDTPSPAEAEDETAFESEEELDWEEEEPVRRTGGFAFPPGYEGAPENSANDPPPEPE